MYTVNNVNVTLSANTVASFKFMNNGSQYTHALTVKLGDLTPVAGTYTFVNGTNSTLTATMNLTVTDNYGAIVAKNYSVNINLSTTTE